MANAKIMVVEDDALVAAHLERALQQMGYEVAGALAAGAEAVEQAGVLRPDLALMDIKLRDKMTGIEAAALLRERWDIPVVYLTAYADEAMLRLAQTTEPYGYLSKPVRDKELYASIEMALYKHRADRRLNHLTEILRAMHEVNQVITRDHDRPRLLSETCQILVKTRGYGLVWIGQPETADRLTPVARAGQGQDLVDMLAGGEGHTGASPCFKAVRARQQIVCQDMAAELGDTPCCQALLARGLASSVVTPMRHAGQVLGLLCVHADKPNAFDEEELALLDELAGDLALALNNINEEAQRRQVEEALKLKVDELTALGQAAQAVNATLELNQVLSEILALAVKITIADHAGVVLVNEAGRPLQSAENINGMPALSYRIRQTGFTQWITTARQAVIVDEIQRNGVVTPPPGQGAPRRANPYLVKTGVKAMAGLPLLAKNGLVGVLYLHSRRPGAFKGQLPLLTVFANQAATALENARLYETAQRELAERKQAEERLRQRNRDLERLTTAIEQSAENVVITDVQGNIVYVNPAFERVTGYSRVEALGQNPRLLQSGRQDAAFYQHMWSTIAAGQVWRGRLVNKKKDGALYTAETTISPVKDENGVTVNYVAVQRDITRELQLEEQYRQAQKMEAVGQLTAGIAHDFNNLLTAINGFAELAQSRLAPDHALRDMLDRILNSGQRAADLVKQLMAFSRKQVLDPKVLSLNTVVTATDKMLQRIIGEHITLKTALALDLWPVKVDPAQIEQVIVNLAVNARDAMPNGGCLTIETANVTLDDEYAAQHLGAPPGEYAQLAVSDNGLGMSAEVMAHIFEPFFTTKETGKGTGLGLATVFGVVKQSGGHIWCYTEEGQGTTFKIYLPRVYDIAAPILPEAIHDLPAGHETVLVVEDAPAVRELVARVLRQQGYTVLEAEDSAAALRLAQEYAGSIHLLLSDVVMPGVNGKALAGQLAQIRPGLKVLFMSGYADDAIVRHGVLEPGVAFLPKPFTTMALTRKVREALDSPDPDPKGL